MEQSTLAEIRAAASVLDGVAVVTPLERCRWLSQTSGRDVWLKHEQLQRTGSFKIRGAFYRMSRLSDEERARPVVAASAGNHAQGVALAADLLGLSCVVFMPVQAPLPKEKATRGYGAEVRFCGHSVDEALLAAQDYAVTEQATLIHPFDHHDVVTGQATLGLELMPPGQEPDCIVVPCGGGGLVAGVQAATAALAAERGIAPPRIIAVQAQGAASYRESLKQGLPIAWPQLQTMSDGIAVALPGAIPFGRLAAATTAGAVEWVEVSEEWTSRAVLKLMERSKAIVEPAGAVGVAALMQDPTITQGRTTVVLSGGNIDPLTLMNIIRHGLVAAGRYLELEITIPDRPGGLARLLALLASAEANVLEVNHQRSASGIDVGEVEVQLVLETRGESHAEQVRRQLVAADYRL